MAIKQRSTKTQLLNKREYAMEFSLGTFLNVLRRRYVFCDIRTHIVVRVFP